MKRILVPTDFSPTAEKAFRFALDLARKAKGTIILYHNYTPVESPFIGTQESLKQHNIQSKADIAKRLQRLKKKVTGNAADVVVSTTIGRSPLISNILNFAKHHDIDLIIMGTQGASGLKKTIIGSLAARIVEKSDLPVLLIPEKYELEAPRKFVFATNCQPADQQALTVIKAMLGLYNADLTVLHFLSAYATGSEKVKERTDFDTYALSVQRELNGSKIKFHLLEIPSVTETMETLDKKFPYDLIAMVRRKKTFFEKFYVKSFTKNMAYVTKKPLLVVPEEVCLRTN